MKSEHDNGRQPSVGNGRDHAAVKPAWVTPRLVVLDASETATGPMGMVEETPINKPGS